MIKSWQSIFLDKSDVMAFVKKCKTWHFTWYFKAIIALINITELHKAKYFLSTKSLKVRDAKLLVKYRIVYLGYFGEIEFSELDMATKSIK